jgi:ABC-type cobalamin/Fe3+-siderophores transport system ATPase subunit
MDNTMIKLENINASYKNSDFELIFNLEINKGEKILLIGPNGSGKSTLMKLISGHISPVKGEISVNNNIIETFSLEKLSSLISYMPQSPYMPGHFDVFEFVLSGCFSKENNNGHFKKSDYKKVFDILSKMNLENKWNSKLSNLSGGEKQMALLAHNLIQQSSIQLFDEPSANLDPFNQTEIMNLLLENQTSKDTKIISTHDLNISWKFNRIIMIKHGTIFKQGSPNSIITTENLTNLFEKNIEVLKLKNNKNVVLYN